MNMSSICRIIGKTESSCGYCDSKIDSSVSYGMVSSQISAEDYESLMLRGWRRSGIYLSNIYICLIYLSIFCNSYHNQYLY
jgi:arginyl-tRNA--protein-N-Asp/Glu arginylyltransferase